ncbi:anaerobic C4-dicarboxylate transporter family protein [Streptomyces gamaensis]|uniref:Anaerobic C4-dicarboxylate transporter family protein n=1 Tax=Streptomyces gamaensis TaxID=1763542 RepID=A0ABW0Z7H3_9ACTN
MLLQLAVMLAAIALGSRKGGVGMGLWGAVGVFVLATVFQVAPADTAGIVDVMLIILAVIMAAAAMEAAGGIQYLVAVAERMIRRHPSRVTFIAPVVSWLFTLGAGTAHVFYPLLPVIHDVAREGGVRPERPIAVSSIASTVGITASPVSAAMAAMIVMFDGDGWTLPKIMAVAVPATLLGVLTAAAVQSRIGKDLPAENRQPAARESAQLPPRAALSAGLFLAGTLAVVVSGLFPQLRPSVPGSGGSAPLSMPAAIEIIMMAVAAVILLLCKVDAAKVPGTDVARSGLVAVIGVFGLSWLGLTFIGHNQKLITEKLGGIAHSQPWFFAVMLLLLSALLFSQATTTKALMPLGVALGIPAPLLIAMWPAVNGYFLLPTYGTFIAAINFDRSGTTRIGRFVLNHSFMLPGLITTGVSVGCGFGIVEAFF